jgi:hypothetical protein
LPPRWKLGSPPPGAPVGRDVSHAHPVGGPQGSKYPFKPDPAKPPEEGCPWNFYRSSGDVRASYASIVHNLGTVAPVAPRAAPPRAAPPAPARPRPPLRTPALPHAARRGAGGGAARRGEPVVPGVLGVPGHAPGRLLARPRRQGRPGAPSPLPPFPVPWIPGRNSQRCAAPRLQSPVSLCPGRPRARC